ncbi:MAG: DNA cytosine methyltransferase [Candidatus Symbiobacter sp.]|nr:DNA cytosine methyltransferase [Candidatus Symbiobacter sp.]
MDKLIEENRKSNFFPALPKMEDFIVKGKHSVVSLFSGCGGMDLGFLGGFDFLRKTYEKNNFDIIWANELNPTAIKTYQKNIGGNVFSGDIWQQIDKLPPKAEIVIGGFPCQDISVNGKGAGAFGNKSGLYRAMVEVVARIMPKIFVAENVKGLLMRHQTETLSIITNAFSDLGYNVTSHLLHAADYGVPQTRERVIIVGTLPEIRKFVPPKPVLHPFEYITAEQAIGDLANLAEDETFNHIWSRAELSPDQGDRRLKHDRPGYTIRAECHGNIHWHYSLKRRISMREALRIQSFPDNFVIQAKLREAERQIGNAVPPVLAWHVAKSVETCLA